MEILAAAVLGLTLYGVAAALVPEVTSRARWGEGAEPGPRPGYVFYPGEAVDWGRLGLQPGVWELVSLESFTSGQRSRLVLTLLPTDHGEALAPLELVRALELVTKRALSASEAEVVVVELARRPREPSVRENWVALRSSDGRGWSGRERGAYFVVESPVPVSTSEAAASASAHNQEQE